VPEKAKQADNIIPRAEEWLLTLPLYSSWTYKGRNDNNAKEILRLEFYDRPLDVYCSGCDRETAFMPMTVFPLATPRQGNEKIASFDAFWKKLTTVNVQMNISPDGASPPSYNSWTVETLAYRDRPFFTQFECPREYTHKVCFAFLMQNGTFTKIGQYPSLADLNEYEVRQYKKALGNEKYVEFTKAIGLTSHGIGIGAFVYLRRIFEALVEEAYTKASVEEDWDEDAYTDTRMVEKVQLLRDYLPEFLVKNRKIYSILSLGIHELNEQDCLKHFDVLRASIELILDQKIEEMKRAEKKARAEAGLTKIHEDIS
jgi:hypothetical protein